MIQQDYLLRNLRLFLITVLIIGGISLSFFKTTNSVISSKESVKEPSAAIVTKVRPTVKPKINNVQYTDMTADNWELRVPDCLLGSAPADNPKMTEVYLSIHAPEKNQTIVYEEIGINKLKKSKYVVPPMGYFKRCFSSEHFRFNMDYENFASFLDFICVARYNAGEIKAKSTESKIAYHQSVFIAIHETRTGNIVHELSTEISTAYFPRNTSKEVINTRLQKNLKNGLAKIKFPKLIDPELVEKRAKL